MRTLDGRRSVRQLLLLGASPGQDLLQVAHGTAKTAINAASVLRARVDRVSRDTASPALASGVGRASIAPRPRSAPDHYPTNILSSQLGTGAITRAAIEAHLGGPKSKRCLMAAGVGHSGHSDISERIEEILRAEVQRSRSWSTRGRSMPTSMRTINSTRRVSNLSRGIQAH
jgi:hypothetical protein